MSDNDITNEIIMKLFCVSKKLDIAEHNVVIVNSEEKRLIMNETGSMIWDLIDDNRTCNDIAKLVYEHLPDGDDTNYEEVINAVVDFVKSLKDVNLAAYSGKMSIWADD